MAADPRARAADCESVDPTELELQVLSYAVSHDLSASVRHLSTFSLLMAAEIGTERTQRQVAFAKQLEAANEHCVAMLEQLLVYSRVQSRALDRRTHDPTDAVRLAGLRLAAGAERTEISVAPLGEVYGDSDLVVQAAAALIDNAVKFRRKGAAARVTIEPAHDRSFWRMHVRDDGVGVEVRHREAAFAMFRRLNSPGVYPGVGAGLAICRRIARRHGGEARFLDCAEGACLEFALPKAGNSLNRRARGSRR